MEGKAPYIMRFLLDDWGHWGSHQFMQTMIFKGNITLSAEICVQ